jgi:hypothetical protein
MESLGMLLAFPVTAAASAVYAGLAVYVFSGSRVLRWVLVVGSVVVVVFAFSEAGLVWTAHGVVPARGWIGPRFQWLHNIVFFFTPPAVANLMVFVPRPPLRDWKLVAGVTFLVAITLVFWNIDVSEKLYGPDGIGGPYSDEKW